MGAIGAGSTGLAAGGPLGATWRRGRRPILVRHRLENANSSRAGAATGSAVRTVSRGIGSVGIDSSCSGSKGSWSNAMGASDGFDTGLRGRCDRRRGRRLRRKRLDRACDPPPMMACTLRPTGRSRYRPASSSPRSPSRCRWLSPLSRCHSSSPYSPTVYRTSASATSLRPSAGRRTACSAWRDGVRVPAGSWRSGRATRPLRREAGLRSRRAPARGTAVGALSPWHRGGRATARTGRAARARLRWCRPSPISICHRRNPLRYPTQFNVSRRARTPPAADHGGLRAPDQRAPAERVFRLLE